MSNDFESLDLSEIQDEYARVSKEGKPTENVDYLEKFVRMPQGEGFTVVRILPRRKGQKLFCVTRIHTLSNPTTGRSKSYHCPRELVKGERGDRWVGDCIVCKIYSDLWEQSEKATSEKEKKLKQDQARALKPAERYYYNVVVRSEKDKDNVVKNNVGPKIYSCGKSVHSKIIRAILGDETAGEDALGDVTHPKNGRDFKIVKKVKGEYPDYNLSTFQNPSVAGTEEEIARWCENLHDLQSLRQLKSKDELKHALMVHLGRIKEGEREEDEDLKEFRDAYSEVVNTTSDTLKEELVVSTPDNESNPIGDDDDILADDDFMKELS